MRMKIVLLHAAILLLTLLMVSTAKSEDDNTILTGYSTSSNIVFYNTEEISSQTARFDVIKPCRLNSVKIRFYAKSEGVVRLHLYGSEGGANYPILKRDLIESREIRIDKKGYVVKNIHLHDENIVINNRQFFVMIDSMSSGISLISDSEAKESYCIQDSSRMYTNQIIEYKDGRKRLGKYGYDIACKVEYLEKEIKYFYSDVTSDYINEDILKEFSEEQIAAQILSSDFNDDGYTDLMLGGKLLLNIRGEEFKIVNKDYGITGQPKLSAFIDINSDGKIDIFFYGFADKTENNAVLYLQQDNSFEKIELYLPILDNPRSFAIGDINKDNYSDIFISQGGNSKNQKNILLINDQANGFKDISNHLGTGEQSSVGVSFVDFDSDDDLDLFVVNEFDKNELWQNKGNEVFENVIDQKFRNYLFKDSTVDNCAILAYGNGCNWVDYDNDGDYDVILPINNFMRSNYKNLATTSSIVENQGIPSNEFMSDYQSEIIQFSEEFSGARWVDIDNNGLKDFILTSEFECKQPEIYLQTKPSQFEWKSYKSGFGAGLNAEDILPVDINSDGRIDIIGFDNGQIKIFKNIIETENTSISIDFSKEKGVQIGKRIECYLGDDKVISYLKSGDGIMIQEPLVMTIGTAKHDKIDSLIVHDPNRNSNEKFYKIPTGSRLEIGQLREQYSLPSNSLEVMTYPTPFSEEVSFRLKAREVNEAFEVNEVAILIYSIDGKKIQEITTRMSGGQKEIQWDGRDSKGNAVPAGAYFYEIKYGTSTLSGKLIRV
jgi:VCBS repeat protein/flagellar hook capping protein FlgD